MTAFGIMLAISGIILLVAAVAQAGQNRSYAASSRSATGAVTGKNKVRGKNHTRYELTVAYTVDGVDYHRRLGATAAEYSALCEGDPITLKYKPEKPQKAVRPEQLDPEKVRTLRNFGLILIAAALIMLWIGRI